MLGELRDGDLYIEGLKYEFPKRPPLNTMRNYGLPKIKQVWKRRTDDEQFDWSDGWEDRLNENPDQVQFIVDEVERLNSGEWIYIGGEPTYINNYCYFFLSHFILEDSGEYPEYRDTSLYYYRFVEICDKQRLCTGHTLLKARRLGATSMVMARMLLKALLTRNKSFGITSKTGVDAETAFGFLVNAFQALKPYLKPQMEGNESPKKILSLKKQANRVKKDQKTAGSKEGLNNKVLWRSTALNTFDGGAYEDILVDESGKYPTDVPIDKYLAVVTKCVKKGAKVTGKLCLPTTVNPPNSGGANYRTVWDNSDQSKADYLGQTKTGLNRIIIPAYLGFAGYIDYYGNSVWETPTPEQSAYLESTGECPDPKIGAKAYLEHVRKQLESDDEALQEEIRMNPFTAIEVFESSNNRCLFHSLKDLNQREDELSEQLLDRGMSVKNDELGRRGWFHKKPNGKVDFIDDKKGLWYVHKLLDENESNKFKQDYNGITPLNESFGAAGLDPVHSGQATVDKGSDMCCMIHRRYNAMDEENSDIPIAMFLGRIPDTDEMYNQVYNGLIYYGVKMLAERAPDYFDTYAKRNKLSNYLYGTKRSDGTEVKGIPSQQQANVKDAHARAMTMKALDCWYKIPFIRLIRDMKFFSTEERTDYDACMAWGYSLMALDQPFEKSKKEKPQLRFLMKGRILN